MSRTLSFPSRKPQKNKNGKWAKNRYKAWVNPSAYSHSSQQDSLSQLKKLLGDKDALIFDTETTGLKEDARIIELSIIDMDGNSLFSELFNPEIELPERPKELTGLTDEDLKDKRLFKEAYEEISRIVKGKVLLAWNSDFDKKRLKYEESLVLFDIDIQDSCALQIRDFIDAMELYSYATGKNSKYCKLAVAMKEMGIEEPQEHRAMGDCLCTLAVLRKAVEVDGDISKVAAEKDLFSDVE